MSVTVHGTAVMIEGCGVLIRGKSGSGKSSLALRLIDSAGFGLGDTPMRGQLVADDQVALSREDGTITLSAPQQLAGRLEVRGYGIVRLAHVATAPLGLVVDLMDLAQIERMPDETALQTDILGVTLRSLAIDAADPAAPARIRVAVAKPFRDG